MLLYNVTININKNREADWLQWMQTEHIPDVMSTGLPASYKLLRLLTEIDNGGSTYTAQYFFKSLAEYEQYESIFAPALQRKLQQRFQNDFVAFRTVLEEIEFK